LITGITQHERHLWELECGVMWDLLLSWMHDGGVLLLLSLREGGRLWNRGYVCVVCCTEMIPEASKREDKGKKGKENQMSKSNAGVRNAGVRPSM
jgi:hypothetical protein